MEEQESKEMELFLEDCKKKLDNWQNVQLQTARRQKLTLPMLRLLVNPCFSFEQMNEIRQGFAEGLNQQEVESYAEPDTSAEKMMRQRQAHYQEKESLDRIYRMEELLNQYHHELDRQKEMNTFFVEHVETLRAEEETEKGIEEKERDTMEKKSEDRVPVELPKKVPEEKAKEEGKEKESLVQVVLDFYRSQKQGRKKKEVRKLGKEKKIEPNRGKEKKEQPDIIDLMCSGSFQVEQLMEIRTGDEHGLDMGHILKFAKPELSAAMMREIRMVQEAKQGIGNRELSGSRAANVQEKEKAEILDPEWEEDEE